MDIKSSMTKSKITIVYLSEWVVADEPEMSSTIEFLKGLSRKQ